MRPRWLLIAVLTMSLLPSLASARTRIRPRAQYSIGAAFEPGLHAGKLVLAFYNLDDARSIELPIRVRAGTIQYDWLTVELSNPTTSRTLTFVADRDRAAVEMVTLAPHATAFETVDLDAVTRDLSPGEYDVHVTWDGHETTTKTFVPYRCGLSYRPPAPASPPSKLPYVLGGLALAALVGRAAKRAGTTDVRVPCSAS